MYDYKGSFPYFLNFFIGTFFLLNYILSVNSPFINFYRFTKKIQIPDFIYSSLMLDNFIRGASFFMLLETCQSS